MLVYKVACFRRFEQVFADTLQDVYVSHSKTLNCTSDNVVYLITCNKCGIQYVGETCQKLRNRLNNHRSSLKRPTNLYLYHFSSDGHSEDDICIIPIEEITPGDSANVTSVRLEREDYWCRELCTYYPYGLNDNVRGVGNCRVLLISLCKHA